MSQNTLVTPSFVIHKDELLRDMKSFYEDVIRIHANTIVSYSFKTNYYSAVIECAHEAGLWAEVVSEDEYYMAKRLGYDKKIVYNGPVKSFDTFKNALYNNEIVNIDSERELDWIEKLDSTMHYNIGLRLNYTLSEYCDEVREKESLSRFGFFSDDLQLILKRIRNMSNVSVVGFHMHRSGNSRSTYVYNAIVRAALSIAQKNNIDLKYIDVGGGFKLGVSNDMTAEKYMYAIKEALTDFNKDHIKIILEPGNSLVYPSIDYVAQIIDMKQCAGNVFATLDGSRIHIDPLFRRSKYLQVDICQVNTDRKNHGIDKLYLCGFTCKETDIITILENVDVQVDDLVWFRKVGAYTMSLIPEFISAFPQVYIETNGKLYVHHEKQML